MVGGLTTHGQATKTVALEVLEAAVMADSQTVLAAAASLTLAAVVVLVAPQMAVEVTVALGAQES